MARAGVLAGLVLVLAAGAAGAAPLSVAVVFGRETLSVTDRVHLIRKPAVTDPPFEGNVVVIEQDRGLVVVDAGGSPASGEAVAARIRGISRKPVRYLVLTHYHGDHTLGAKVLQRYWPELRIIAHERTAANLAGPPMDYVKTYAASYAELAKSAELAAADAALPHDLSEGWARVAAAGPAMVEAYAHLDPPAVDIAVSERLTLTDSDAPVEIAFLGRGNTDGDLVVWAPRQRVLASGDLVVAPIPYAAHTYPSDWIAALGRLQTYDFAWLIPGHGAPMDNRIYVSRLRAALETLRDQVAPLAKAGLPLDDVRKRVELGALRAEFTHGDPWGDFVFGAVFSSDLISNLYKEARGEPVIQGKG